MNTATITDPTFRHDTDTHSACADPAAASTTHEGTLRRGPSNDRGEGIISTAIAVLIIAALGVVAYGAFNGLFDTASSKAETQIENIGG